MSVKAANEERNLNEEKKGGGGREKEIYVVLFVVNVLNGNESLINYIYNNKRIESNWMDNNKKENGLDNGK